MVGKAINGQQVMVDGEVVRRRVVNILYMMDYKNEFGKCYEYASAALCLQYTRLQHTLIYFQFL